MEPIQIITKKFTFLMIKGNSWENITYNLGNMPIRSVVIDHTENSTIYLGAEIGVYKKTMDARIMGII